MNQNTSTISVQILDEGEQNAFCCVQIVRYTFHYTSENIDTWYMRLIFLKMNKFFG